MATSFTYTTLKAAITAHVENDGSDFSDSIDTLIQLGEDKAIKDLDLEIFDTEEDVTISSAIVTKPTDAITVRSLYYLASSARKFIEPRSREYCLDYWPNLASTASVPKYWAEYSATQLLVVPTPTASLSGKAMVIKRPTGLSGSNETSWLGTNAGDVLFYACLVCAERFEVADERINVWKAAYDDALDRTRVDIRHLLRRDYATGTQTAKAQGER